MNIAVKHCWASRNAGKLVFAVSAMLAAVSIAYAAQEPAGKAGVASELSRPDVDNWPTIGSTMRTDPANPTIPAQLRQVQMDPRSFAEFLTTRRFIDGTIFSVLFYSTALDKSHAPPFYHANTEVAFAMEVIDRSHPDGRRFYTFAPGAQRAKSLPAGNDCAVCHRERGTFDGTFAHLYPPIASRVSTTRGVQPTTTRGVQPKR